MNLLKTIALLTVVAKVQGLSSSSSSGHAWHFTDVHLDPLYTVNASIFNYCNGNVSQNDSLKAGVFGSSQGNCATPRTLYESAVEFMHENSQDSADIVLFTGDFTQAGLSSEMAVYETIAEAFQRLQEGFPGVKGIYGTVGNHDKYPGDVFPYPYDGYRVLASIWQPYLDSQAVETVIDGGYYSMNVNENLRIISINTNYLATLNPLVKNTSNPAYHFGFKMMDWFEDELRNASESDTNVWILGHIPFETWLPEHLNRYQRLISTYSPKTVKGQFYGHDHEDYVRLTRNCDSVCDGKASGVVWIGPALTEGYPSENPGIRQYEYDTSSFSIQNAKTFYTDLIRANKRGEVEWELEYEMLNEFDMLHDLSAESFEALYRAMLRNVTKFSAYDSFNNYFSLRRRHYDGPLSSGTSTCDPESSGTTCVESILCQVLYADPDLISTCENNTAVA